MRIATYNLRYDSMPDNVSVQESLKSLPDPLIAPNFLSKKGEQPWSMRRLRVSEHISTEGVVVAGFQEALWRQVNDIAELLGSDWSWIGAGRDDGAAAGEFSPIFYRKSVISLISSDTFWLSETPLTPSKFPDAGSFRICTVGHFTLLAGSRSGRPTSFTVLNTHLDDQSDNQRRLAASLLLTRARYEAVNTSGPVLMTGDFNSSSSGTDSAAYNITTGLLPPVAINSTFAAKYSVPDDQQSDFRFLDLRAETPRHMVSGNFATFTDFVKPGDISDYVRIDFVFGGSNGGWIANAYKVGTSLTDDGTLASDHRPVFADVSI